MTRSNGCRVWDAQGREYIDYMMALGAVSLGYAHPGVVAAVNAAVKDGTVGSLAPVHEDALAERLQQHVPAIETVRFLKTGAEAVMAAIRIARVVTGRPRIVTVGYQGWLDATSSEPGVPDGVKKDRTDVPFNNVAALEAACQDDQVGALVLEPTVDGPPTESWVKAVHDVRTRHRLVVVLDEIKTGLRLGPAGGQGRWDYPADLVVMGKALANGFPLALVGGHADVMDGATRTWISSTLATEFVSLAAALAVLDTYERDPVVHHLMLEGGRWYMGLEEAARSAPQLVEGVSGIPEFCYLKFKDVDVGKQVAARCAEHGMLFKYNAYNFVSFAHDESVIRESLGCLTAVLEEIAWS